GRSVQRTTCRSRKVQNGREDSSVTAAAGSLESLSIVERSAICATGLPRRQQLRVPSRLLQPKALVQQPLKARLVDEVVGEFLVREHCQRGLLSIGGEFRCLLNRQLRILTDYRHDHVHHDL